MTIKIIYNHECDGCKKIIMTEKYNWTSSPNWSVPQPNKNNLFVLYGFNADLCVDCAQPLLEVKNLMMEKIIKVRGEK